MALSQKTQPAATDPPSHRGTPAERSCECNFRLRSCNDRMEPYKRSAPAWLCPRRRNRQPPTRLPTEVLLQSDLVNVTSDCAVVMIGWNRIKGLPLHGFVPEDATGSHRPAFPPRYSCGRRLKKADSDRRFAKSKKIGRA